MTDYLDASAVVSIILTEGASGRVVRSVEAALGDILISEFVVAEASSAISRLVRMGEQTLDEGAFLIRELDDWIAATAELSEIEPSDFADATDLVRNFDLKLRAPDALHLAITRRLDARLITLDKNLATAAAVLGVAYINPAETDASIEPKT